MKKIILLLTFVSMSFNNTVYANEVKCKVYDVICKGKKFAIETKEYQTKEYKKAFEKIEKTKKKSF